MRVERPADNLDDRDDEFSCSLSDVLRPEPLPAALRDRIRADFDRRCAASRPLRVKTNRLVAVALAASVMLVLMLPMNRAERTLPRSATLSLTSDEAAVIVAAYGVLSWDSPAEYTLDVLDDTLDNLERSLRREDGSTSGLPWGPQDDWDVPPTTDEGSSLDRPNSTMNVSIACALPRDRRVGYTGRAPGFSPPGPAISACLSSLENVVDMRLS